MHALCEHVGTTPVPSSPGFPGNNVLKADDGSSVTSPEYRISVRVLELVIEDSSMQHVQQELGMFEG